MSVTDNLGLTLLEQAQAAKEVLIATNDTILDAALTKPRSFALTGAGPTTLNATQVTQSMRLRFTGSPTANHKAVVPSLAHLWFVMNDCTVAIQIGTSGGAVITLASGSYATIYCDGTDCFTSSGGTASPQTTIAGTTAGTAVCSQPFSQAGYKKALVYLNGYNNTTGTAQTYTFPTAFSHTPLLVANSDPEASVSTTTLTLPASMSGPVTGWIIIEGY